VSDKLLRGGILYRDAIDTKPPFVFLHYATVFGLFGRDQMTAVKIVTMVWIGVSALVTSRIYKELFPSDRTPEWAALLFVLASFSGWGEDFLSSNTEILSNLFVLAGVWCMVRDDFSDWGPRLMLGGMMIGIASLYRNQSGAALAAYVVTVAARRRELRRIAHRFFYVGLGWLIPIAAVIGYYAWIDGLPDLALLVRYQSYYLRSHDVYWPQVLGQVAIVVVSQAPFLLLAGWQVIGMARRPLTTRDAFLLSFLTCSVLPFFIGSHYFAHYFVQAIPALVLLATQAVSSTVAPSDAGLRAFPSRVRTYAIVNVVAFTMVNAVYYRNAPTDAPHPALAAFIQEHTTPDEPLFLWTSRSHVLFETHRVFATRFLSNEFLTGRLFGSRYRLPNATSESASAASIPELWPVLLQDLRAERPRVIIDDGPGLSHFTLDRYPVLAAFAREQYEACRVMDGFCVYLRKAG
jgi:hypothetical protein